MMREQVRLWDQTFLADGWSVRVYVHPEYAHRTPEAARQVNNCDVAVLLFQPNGDLDIWSEEAPVTVPGEVMSKLVQAYAEFMSRQVTK
jgi:hypothetical protein